MKERLSPCDPRLTPAERLAHYTRIDPLSGCHIWHGSNNHAGYGKLNVRNKSLAVHAARAATGPESARIYILYRGLELSGEVAARQLGLLAPGKKTA